MGNCVPKSYTFETKFLKKLRDTESRKAMVSTDSTVNAESMMPTMHSFEKINYSTINANREFHNEESSTYWLPKDEHEQKRLTGVNIYMHVS